MQERMVGRGKTDYTHFVLDPKVQATDYWGRLTKAPPAAVCITPRGEPICTCGATLLVWEGAE